MKVSASFFLWEFVPKETWDKWGQGSLKFIDRRVVDIAQLIRDLTGRAVTINNWKAGGQYNYSGYRPPSCTEGATESQHRSGRGIDVKVAGMTPAQVYELIKANWQKFKAAGLTTVEDVAFTPSWIHLDCRWTGIEEPLIVKP